MKSVTGTKPLQVQKEFGREPLNGMRPKHYSYTSTVPIGMLTKS